jgi:hypothetical protein
MKRRCYAFSIKFPGPIYFSVSALFTCTKVNSKNSRQTFLNLWYSHSFFVNTGTEKGEERGESWPYVFEYTFHGAWATSCLSWLIPHAIAGLNSHKMTMNIGSERRTATQRVSRTPQYQLKLSSCWDKGTVRQGCLPVMGKDAIQVLHVMQKSSSWTYNFIEVSWHNLGSSRTGGFRKQCLHYKPVSDHFFSSGVGVGGDP